MCLEVETAKEDDRTEDQVPDISGTENVGDQMTISVDEIEEIPAAEDGDVDQQGDAEQTDVPDQLENGDEEGAADIPVDVMGGATQEDQHPEEAAAEVAEDAPIAEEDVPEPEEAPVEETKAPVDEAADEEPQAEDEEPPVQEEEQKQQEPAQHEGFQLQDPPTPKRPRTPNQLDGGDAREDAFPLPGSQPQTPKSSVRGSQPSTPAANAEPVENGFPTSPRRTSNVSGVSKRSEDVPQTPKSPASSIRRESNVSAAPKSPASSIRRESNASSVPKSPLANGSVQPGTPLANGSVLPGTPTPATPRSGAIAASPRTPKAGGGETPKTKTEFVFEEASPVPSPKSPKKTTFEEDILSTSSTKSKSKSPPKSPPKSPRSPRKVRRAKLARSPEPEAAEPEVTEPEAPEPEAEAAPAEEPQEAPQEEETPVKEPTPAADEEDTGAGDEAPPSSPPARSRARVQSPSPPPRASARAEREPAPRDYVPYDQDSHRETVPARLPTSTSFSSWVAPERQSYQAISPWVNTAGKYRNEHTTGVPEHTAAYTSFFDDLVSTGPFSHSLYATSRLLERSRSRTRERRSALRSQRSASNYYRFASQFPPPLRTRDYSTPPTSAMHKAPGRAGSFISFMDYSGSKNYDLARNASRGSLYDSNLALSRTSSRGNIDYYLGSGRISRVDSYVNNLNSRYEWQVPSNYETYRSASRSHVAGYTPINDYTSYSNPLYQDPRRVRETGMVRSMYEGRIDDLQRNLSRERYERDRLRSRYTMVASQLEQACKQMDLLRTNSYAFQRSGSTPRTSVYANFYPSKTESSHSAHAPRSTVRPQRLHSLAITTPPHQSAQFYRTPRQTIRQISLREASIPDLRAAGRNAHINRNNPLVRHADSSNYNFFNEASVIPQRSSSVSRSLTQLPLTNFTTNFLTTNFPIISNTPSNSSHLSQQNYNSGRSRNDNVDYLSTNSYRPAYISSDSPTSSELQTQLDSKIVDLLGGSNYFKPDTNHVQSSLQSSPLQKDLDSAVQRILDESTKSRRDYSQSGPSSSNARSASSHPSSRRYSTDNYSATPISTLNYLERRKLDARTLRSPSVENFKNRSFSQLTQTPHWRPKKFFASDL